MKTGECAGTGENWREKQPIVLIAKTVPEKFSGKTRRKIHKLPKKQSSSVCWIISFINY
jgi:hypothetical protein